jgi:hypothetical protein
MAAVLHKVILRFNFISAGLLLKLSDDKIPLNSTWPSHKRTRNLARIAELRIQSSNWKMPGSNIDRNISIFSYSPQSIQDKFQDTTLNEVTIIYRQINFIFIIHYHPVMWHYTTAVQSLNKIKGSQTNVVHAFIINFHTYYAFSFTYFLISSS